MRLTKPFLVKMSQEKSYQTATHNYDAKTYEQASQMKLIADAIANGKKETIEMFEHGGVIKLNGLLKKLKEKE